MVRRIVITLTMLCSMTATAWACPPTPPDDDWKFIGLGTLLPLSLIGSLMAVMGSWDRLPPSQRIPTAGVERIARRRRLAWASVVVILLAPSYVFTPFLAVAIGPLAFLVRAQLAISR